MKARILVDFRICISVPLRDFPFFFTGFDRIPAYGMPKLIDVNFDKEIGPPKISTCALSVTLSVINIEKALKTIISFGMHSEIFSNFESDNSFEVLLSHSFYRASTLPRKHFSIIFFYIYPCLHYSFLRFNSL